MRRNHFLTDEQVEEVNTLKTERPPFDIDAAVNYVKEYEHLEKMLKEMGVRSINVCFGVRELLVSKEVFIKLFAGKQIEFEKRDTNAYQYRYSAEYKGVTFGCLSSRPLHVPCHTLMLCEEESAAEQSK